MSRGKTLALLLALILVLGGAAAFLISSNNKKAAEEQALADQQAAEEAAKAPDVAFFMDSSQITRMSWTCLQKQAETWKGEDGVWHVADNDGNEYDCDSAKIQVVLDVLRYVKADRVIEEPGDLSQYGFDDPCADVTIEAQGKTYRLTIGDPCASNKELYYCINDSDSRLYMVSDALAETFYLTRGELLPAAQ